jgi:hypothetical protein
MNRRRSLWLVAGSLLVSLPAAAQQSASCPGSPGVGAGFFGSFRSTGPLPPCPETSLPPLTVHAAPSKPPPVGAPPARPPERADYQIPSTDLGFQRGIGPALGHAVTWQGRKYLVVGVSASDGRPTFAGGSRFVITTAGGSLEIGLKPLGKDVLLPVMADATAIN